MVEARCDGNVGILHNRKSLISLPIVFVGIMLSSTGIGAAAGVPLALAGLSIVLHERKFRRDEAKVFQNLLEREALPRQNQIADQIIAAMNPTINTDQFIGVINNLLERKKVSAELVKPEISDVQKMIKLHYSSGYEEEKMMLDDKAVLQFLLLNSVIGKLKSNSDLLPEVGRGMLFKKFKELGSKFYQHCEARYPEKMTPKCREKLTAALSEYEYSNMHDAEVCDWASGASVVVEMVPVISEAVGATAVCGESRSGGKPAAEAREARVKMMMEQKKVVMVDCSA